MKKRMLSFILMLCIVTTVFVLPASAELTYATESATLGPMEFACWLDEGRAHIQTCDENASGDIVIPSQIKGYTVDAIYQWAFSGCYNIESITLPETMVYIGMYAFGNCVNLKSITMPESVREIQNGAFNGCENLKSITIPARVKEIGGDAFTACYSLESITVNEKNRFYSSLDGVLFNKKKKTLIHYPSGKTETSYTIPDGVTTICEGAFERTNLEEVTIPEGVKSIEGYLFACSANLKTITIPKSITKIDYSAFYDCENISDIYYGGSEEDWKKIDFDGGNYWLSKATVHFSEPEEKPAESPTKKTGTFRFKSGFGNKNCDDGSSSAEYVYDDNYFAETAIDNYNHDLAKMSLRLAMSAFAYLGKGDSKYDNQDKNVKALLVELGFDEEEIENIGYSKKPTTNSIGVIAGNKKVAYEDGEYTLIAVAVRGGNYGSEWGGNFNVGTGEEHKGFQLARDQVLQFLIDYVESAEISGDIKIWLTGYSRAAAVANLTAAYLDTHSLILNGENTDYDKIVQIKPENLFAYCFETPAGTRAEDKNDSKYNNIYSIVNQNDFVPMVAPEEWGYGRYGITYYLPSARSNYDYQTLADDMYVYYDQYVGTKYNTDNAPVIENFDTYKLKWSSDNINTNYGFYFEEQNSNRTMDEFLQTTINDLAKTFESPEYYNEHLEDALVYLGDEIMGKGNEDEFIDIFLDALKRNLLTSLTPYTNIIDGAESIASGERLDLVRNAIKDTFSEMNVSLSDEAIDGVGKLVLELLNNGSLETFIGNIEILPVVHFPELCLAWMDSVEPSKFRNSRKVIVNCPVDLEVYDDNSSLVAAIYDNEPSEIEGSSIVAYVDENGQKVIYLPSDAEYLIEVKATDDGEVTYSVHEEDFETGTTKVINYNQITVTRNDLLYGMAENLTDVEDSSYLLESDTVEITDKEIIEEAQEISVITDCEGNGKVLGGGKFYKGEYAQLTAIPFENEEFLGWYDGEALISSDYVYRLQVQEEMEFTAKFTKNTCEIRYLTSDEELIVVDRILRGDCVIFPNMTQNPNYMILGIYEDKEYTIPADEYNTYSDDAVLYVKVLPKEQWIQFDEVNNKVVVYSDVYAYDVQLMMALYEKGKLKELKPCTVELFEGRNEFDNLITDTGTADELKIFVWDFYTNMKPLIPNYSQKIE